MTSCMYNILYTEPIFSSLLDPGDRRMQAQNSLLRHTFSECTSKQKKFNHGSHTFRYAYYARNFIIALFLIIQPLTSLVRTDTHHMSNFLDSYTVVKTHSQSAMRSYQVINIANEVTPGYKYCQCGHTRYHQ